MIKKAKVAVSIALLSLGAGIFFSATTYAGNSCGGVETAVFSCPQGGGEDITDSGVWGILQVILNIMAAGVGVAAVGGLVFAGMLYASAGDDQGQVKKAIDMIRNVVIGIALFAVMFIAVNYLVPGGILG